MINLISVFCVYTKLETVSKRYQLILLIIPCIIILAYIYFTQSNKIDTIKLKRRLFTTYSPSKNHQLNVYTADTNKENASVLVELKNDQTKKNIYWQPNTSWAYIVWKSENIVYINGTKINLSKNKQYDERDNTGESFYSKKDNNPLYLSILKQEIDEQKIIKQLKDKSNINYADAQGNTLLMIASYTGNMKIFHQLKDNGADISKRNNEGQGVLEFAIRSDLSEKQILKQLKDEIKMGAVITEETKNAVIQPWNYRWKAASCNYKVLDWVYDKLNQNPETDMTAEQKVLLKAARGQKTEGTKEEAKLTDKDGNTMLMIAAGYGNQKLLNNLLAQNLKLTHKNRFGEDALLYAISKDQITTAKQLLEAGMDNQEALLKTAQTGNVKMAELVLKYLDLRSDWYIKQAVIEAMNEGNEDYAYKLFLKLKDKNYKGGTETIYEYAKEMGVEKIIDWYKK